MEAIEVLSKEEELKEEVEEEEVVNPIQEGEELEEDSKEIDHFKTEIEDLVEEVIIKESEERIQRALVRLSANLTENHLIRKSKKRDLMLS